MVVFRLALTEKQQFPGAGNKDANELKKINHCWEFDKKKEK